jgi:hypothetical protein
VELLRLGYLTPPVQPYTMDLSTSELPSADSQTMRDALAELGMQQAPEYGVPCREHDPREQHALYGRVYMPTPLSRLARALVGLEEWPRASLSTSSTATTAAASSPTSHRGGARKLQRLHASDLSLLLEDSDDSSGADSQEIHWEDSEPGDYAL